MFATTRTHEMELSFSLHHPKDCVMSKYGVEMLIHKEMCVRRKTTSWHESQPQQEMKVKRKPDAPWVRTNYNDTRKWWWWWSTSVAVDPLHKIVKRSRNCPTPWGVNSEVMGPFKLRTPREMHDIHQIPSASLELWLELSWSFAILANPKVQHRTSATWAK